MCQTTHNKTGPCPALQNAVITSETPFPLPFQIPPHNAHESKVYYCHCLNCWSLDIIAVFLISQGVVEIFVICIFPPYFTTFLMLFPPHWNNKQKKHYWGIYETTYWSDWTCLNINLNIFYDCTLGTFYFWFLHTVNLHKFSGFRSSICGMLMWIKKFVLNAKPGHHGVPASQSGRVQLKDGGNIHTIRNRHQSVHDFLLWTPQATT